jgi:hypothetical protein
MVSSLAITEGVLRNRFVDNIVLLEMRKVMWIPQLLVVG